MARRVNASLSEAEIAALEAHPEFAGSLGGLLRILALRAAGYEPADPYADHRARPRDTKGRIMPAERTLGYERKLNNAWPVEAKVEKVGRQWRVAVVTNGTSKEAKIVDEHGDESPAVFATKREAVEFMAGLPEVAKDYFPTLLGRE